LRREPEKVQKDTSKYRYTNSSNLTLTYTFVHFQSPDRRLLKHGEAEQQQRCHQIEGVEDFVVDKAIRGHGLSVSGMKQQFFIVFSLLSDQNLN
jgi:hypothetical protein